MKNFTPMKPQAPLVDDEILQLLDSYEMTKKPFMTPMEGYQSPNTEPQIRQAIEAAAQMDVPEVEPLVPELDTEMFSGDNPYAPIDTTTSFSPTFADTTEEGLGVSGSEGEAKVDKVELGTQQFNELLGQYENLATKQQEQLSQAQGQDDQIRLANNLNKTFAQMNAAIANRGGITNIKAQPIDAPVTQVSATKDLMSSEKGILDARMQTIKAQLQREFDRRRIEAQEIQNEESRNLRLKQIENEEAKATQQLQFMYDKLEKETDVKRAAIAAKTKGQTPEMAKLIDADMDDHIDLKRSAAKADGKIGQLDRVMDLIVGDAAESIVQTGRYLGVLKPWTGKRGNQLQTALDDLALKTMVEMFAGMSKAIDSDSERAFFEKTQPSTRNAPEVNLALLVASKSALLKQQAESAAQQAFIAEKGTIQGYVSPIRGKMEAVIDPKTRKMQLVPMGQAPSGMKRWEEFANELVDTDGLTSTNRGKSKLDAARERRSGDPAQDLQQAPAQGDPAQDLQQAPAQGAQSAQQVVRRKTDAGRVALFDSQTKKFIGYED